MSGCLYAWAGVCMTPHLYIPHPFVCSPYFCTYPHTSVCPLYDCKPSVCLYAPYIPHMSVWPNASVFPIHLYTSHTSVCPCTYINPYTSVHPSTSPIHLYATSIFPICLCPIHLHISQISIHVGVLRVSKICFLSLFKDKLQTLM